MENGVGSDEWLSLWLICKDAGLGIGDMGEIIVGI